METTGWNVEYSADIAFYEFLGRNALQILNEDKLFRHWIGEIPETVIYNLPQIASKP